MKKNLTAVLTSILLLTACSDSTTEKPDDNTAGRITVNITDAPVDNADAVVVKFSSIVLKSDNEDDLVFNFNEAKSIDLLALQGLVSQPLLEDQLVPSGRYNQIRLGVNAEFDSVMDSYITIDGTQYELQVPSGSQTGLKLNTPFTVAAGTEQISVADENSIYTIDFDLRKSIVDAKGQPGYFLKPVLRLVQNVNTGSLSGLVDTTLLIGDNCSDDDPLTGNAVYVFAGSNITPDDFDSIETDPLTTALVKFNEQTGNYSYEVGYLSEASYTVAFTCAADLDDENDNSDVVLFDIVDNISIAADENTDFPIAAPLLM